MLKKVRYPQGQSIDALFAAEVADKRYSMMNSSETGHRPEYTKKGFDTHLEYATIIVCAIIFVAVSLFLKDVSNATSGRTVIFGISFSTYVFSGVLAQVQVLTCVYLAIHSMLKGYLASIVLNMYGIGFAIMGMVMGKNENTLPGIIAYIGTVIVVTNIYIYRKQLYSTFTELSKQKEELLALYEELSASEEKLCRQNEDLTEYNRIMKDNERQLRHMAFYDELTGLPNRKMITEWLDRLIRIWGTKNRSFAFIFIDLDNFKEINDLMGHHVGDKILQAIANRWKFRLKRSDILGRLGGDEFALIIRRELSREDILSYIKSLKDVISDVFVVENKEFYIGASFGISVYPQDGANTADLLRNSDIAMYTVKNSGKNDIQFFCRSMQDRMLEKMNLENGLKNALPNNELYVVYQPQYTCGSKRIRGFEALARWHSVELGPVSPAQFIPAAEESGLIVEIGKWIMSTALNRFASLQIGGRKDFILSINISVVQIIQPSFVAMVRQTLEETGFDSHRLEIEVTESVFISNPNKVISILNQLKDMGVRIALDDFGTGYASLKYLQLLPIDTLKIDKSFIDSICEKHSENQIVGTVISLAHELGMTVVAEGVENQLQMQYLTEQKCDLIQGFLLSKPLYEGQLDHLTGDGNQISRHA